MRPNKTILCCKKAVDIPIFVQYNEHTRQYSEHILCIGHILCIEQKLLIPKFILYCKYKKDKYIERRNEDDCYEGC